MKLRTALPAGLVNIMCKRTDPERMGGHPPIRFVPAPTAKQEDGEEPDQVKITISSEVSKYYAVFKEGTAEDVINLICVHEGIVTDKKLNENCTKSQIPDVWSVLVQLIPMYVLSFVYAYWDLR